MQDLRLRGSLGAGRAGLPAVFPRCPGGRVVAGCKTCPEFLSLREQQTSRDRSVEMRALFAMPVLDTRKLTVSYMSADASDVKELNKGQPRRYTVTHNDLTAQLHISIGEDFNQQQISGWYSKLVRDEVVAEWSFAGGPALHLYCHVSGAAFWMASAHARNSIFAREMPLVLDSIAFAERALFKCATLQNAAVFVHFEAREVDLERVEYWGTLGEWICRDQSSSVREHLDRVSHHVLGARLEGSRTAWLEGSLSSLLDVLAAFRFSGREAPVNPTGDANSSTPLECLEVCTSVDTATPEDTTAPPPSLGISKSQPVLRQGNASKRPSVGNQSSERSKMLTTAAQQARVEPTAAAEQGPQRSSRPDMHRERALSSKGCAAAVAECAPPARRRTRDIERTATTATRDFVPLSQCSHVPQSSQANPPLAPAAPSLPPAPEASVHRSRTQVAAAGSINRNAQGSWRALYSPQRCLLCGGALPQQSCTSSASGAQFSTFPPSRTSLKAPGRTGSGAEACSTTSPEACTCVHYLWSPSSASIKRPQLDRQSSSNRSRTLGRISEDCAAPSNTRCGTHVARASERTLVSCAMPTSASEAAAERQPSLFACSAQASSSSRACNSSSPSVQHSSGPNAGGSWFQSPGH